MMEDDDDDEIILEQRRQQAFLQTLIYWETFSWEEKHSYIIGILCHNENTPMQYTCTEIFNVVKNENFQSKKIDIFLIFAQNIDCGYTLEPPWRGGSNEYPQSMFWSKNNKNRYIPAYPSFTI